MKRLLVIAGTVLVASVGLLLIGPADDSYACVPTNQNWCNVPEMNARSGCSTKTGAMWFTSSSSSYFATNVSVSHDAQSVTVYLRGSVWPCGSSIGGGTYADDVRIQQWVLGGGATQDGTMRALDSRFSGYTPGSTLFRGNFQSNGARWTSQGNSIAATMDLSGIPINTSGSAVSHTITVGLWRQYRDDSGSGSAYATRMTLNVTRAAAPWQVSAQAERRTNTGGGWSGWTTSGTPSLRPGDQAQWRHRFTNNGPSSTTQNIDYWYVSSGGLSGTGTVGNGGRWTRASGLGNGSSANWNNSGAITVDQSHVGESDLCRGTRVSRFSSGSVGTEAQRTSAMRCAHVPYNYALRTTIASLPNMVEAGQSITINGTVGFNNSPTKSRPATGNFYRIVYPRGATQGQVQTDRYYTGDACGFYTGESVCDAFGATPNRVWGPTSGTNSATSWTESVVRTNTIPDGLEPGDRICYAFIIRRGADGPDAVRSEIYNSNKAYISPLECTTIGKRPSAQAWGGSLQVGRTFNGIVNPTSSVQGRTFSRPSAGTYGSWSEYGILAPGLVGHVASGSGLNIDGGHSSPAQTSWSPYTFTRSDSDVYGSYSSDGAILPDPTMVFPQPDSSVMWNANLSFIAKDRVVRPPIGTTNVVLTANPGTTFTSGRWLVINAIGHNVTIANDIRYDEHESLNDVRLIPQLIIIANNITINSNVERVDAWLVAKNGSGAAYGAISTCEQQSGSSNPTPVHGTAQWLASGNNYTHSNHSRLSMDRCQSPLVINGPVVANKLYLRRTAGAGGGSTARDPAEVINLRPDAYLWAREHMSPGLIFQNVSERELPPRY